MKLTPVIHSSNRFSWKGNHGLAEMSDFKNQSLHAALFDDAADVGFTVQSERTRKRVEFVFIGRDDNGAFVYVSSNGKYKITLIND